MTFLCGNAAFFLKKLFLIKIIKIILIILKLF